MGHGKRTGSRKPSAWTQEVAPERERAEKAKIKEKAEQAVRAVKPEPGHAAAVRDESEGSDDLDPCCDGGYDLWYFQRCPPPVEAKNVETVLLTPERRPRWPESPGIAQEYDRDWVQPKLPAVPAMPGLGGGLLASAPVAGGPGGQKEEDQDAEQCEPQALQKVGCEGGPYDDQKKDDPGKERGKDGVEPLTITKLMEEVIGDKVDRLTRDAFVREAMAKQGTRHAVGAIVTVLKRKVDSGESGWAVRDVIWLLFDLSMLTSGFIPVDPIKFDGRIVRTLMQALSIEESKDEQQIDQQKAYAAQVAKVLDELQVRAGRGEEVIDFIGILDVTRDLASRSYVGVPTWFADCVYRMIKLGLGIIDDNKGLG